MGQFVFTPPVINTFLRVCDGNLQHEPYLSS